MLNKLKKFACLFICVSVLCMCLTGCDSLISLVTTSPTLTPIEDGQMRVHFFDVGQGDSTFIELPNSETILIDAGEVDQGENVVNKIKNLGYTSVTYVVATHPHSDHIGGLPDVFSAFDVSTVYMPNCAHTTSTFDKLLTAIENESDCTVIQAKQGVTIPFDFGGLYAVFVAPVLDEYDEINNYSACLKIVYANNSFLFMGDAEDVVEYQITDDIDVDVVKVAHHGSYKSSCYNFVSRTNADYAVFQVGADNSYGHPHDEPLNNWKQSGATILRTDIHGDITFTADGSNITYQSLSLPNDYNSFSQTTTQAQSTVQNQEAEDSDYLFSDSDYKYVLNKNSKKIHYPYCSSATSMKSENKEYSNQSYSDLINQGYSPCGSCNPG